MLRLLIIACDTNLRLASGQIVDLYNQIFRSLVKFFNACFLQQNILVSLTLKKYTLNKKRKNLIFFFNFLNSDENLLCYFHSGLRSKKKLFRSFPSKKRQIQVLANQSGERKTNSHKN